jgi:hypothetical protein
VLKLFLTLMIVDFFVPGNCDDWCFLCEFEKHVERASQSSKPFSPINILSRLPNIGGNLGYGRQEDAHEFMRFVLFASNSVYLLKLAVVPVPLNKDIMECNGI